MNSDWKITPDKVLNKEELVNLLRRAEELKTLGIAKKRPQLIRHWMILNTFIFSGLRRFEACELKCGDFKIFGGNSHLVVRRGKGGKPRHVHLPKGYAKNVRWYLRWKIEANELKSPNDYFFKSERSPKFSPSGIYKVWRLYTNHRLHASRHVAASLLLEATNSLLQVKEMLGHANLSTTQVYTHLTSEQRVAGMNSMEQLVGSMMRPGNKSVAKSISHS